MIKSNKLLMPFLVLFLFWGTRTVFAVEPSNADYECYPIFQANAVTPNILILLDNSGSMNFNAYGTYVEAGCGTAACGVTEPFYGDPYASTFEIRVSDNQDDAEERKSDGYSYWSNQDLDFGHAGGGYPNMIIGTRFQSVAIPQGATITKAYITFDADATDSNALALTIQGEDSDDALQFETTNSNISSRTKTTASVSWNPANWVENTTYDTPDLTSIVQEIVDRDGWASGSSMAFIITNPGADPTNARRATAHDQTPAKAPLLHIEYAGAGAVRYYGYFNPDYFYYWNSNKFEHKYKKESYVGDPATAAGHWHVYALTDLDSASEPNAGATTRDLLDSEIAPAIPANGLWDGNFLNWVTMRRVDVIRKVLMGGLATSRTGGGNQTIYGETPAQSSRIYKKIFDTSSGSPVSPYDGKYSYGMKGGDIYIDDDASPFSGALEQHTVAVKKVAAYDPNDFFVYDGDTYTSGVLQKVGTKARWGLEFFYSGTGNNNSGGFIHIPIGEYSTNLITQLQNRGCDTWTPLAESYYIAMQYYKQESPAGSLDYANNAIGATNNVRDPFYNGTEFVKCTKNFVLLLTDGASTKDSKIPSFLKDYDADGNDNTSCNESTGSNCDYPSGGTDYLDDVALYSRANDLRSDLDDVQNMLLYVVYAFGDDPDARSLLKDAARNGGFVDKDSDNRPDGTYADAAADRTEWDEDGDGVPDTYFEATDGFAIERELLKAITAILERAASGTAVSVLATSGEGEGSLVQAYFRPVVTSGITEVNWLGYLQSLWVDSFGNLREDTNANQTLDIGTDKVITYFVDSSSGDTKIKRFAVSAADPYPDVETDPYDTIELNEITAVWQAGRRLAERDADERKIFTYIDKDDDDVVDEASADPFDDSGEVVRFHTGSAAAISPYLGVQDDATWAYLAGTGTNTHANRVTNLIQYIRGNDIAGLRTRTFDYDSDGTDETWKLGDIIHSTPVTISKPPDNFHVIYGDKSYQDFYNAFKDRETVVYVGANDGMLHAFTSWKYNSATLQYEDPYPADGAGDSTYIFNETIGDELWGYIPQSLLPHLKWLPSSSYAHVYYMDMKPKVFDAKILPDDSHYTDTDADLNWGTFILAGFNLGGGDIQVKDDFDYDNSSNDAGSTRNFYPSYVLLDVTEPRAPRVIWERSYGDLQASASAPAVIRVKDKWFAVFGSGPSGCDGESTQTGKVYVVDLATGNPHQSGTNDWLFETAEANAFMNSPVSLDKALNFNVDALYFGETYLQGASNWKGKVYKLTIPWADNLNVYDGTALTKYSDNPKDAVNPWLFSELFDATRPVTTTLSLSVDAYENVWIYGGTGRYLNNDDKNSTVTEYFFGIKDPFFNQGLYESSTPVYYHSYSSTKGLAHSHLLDVDGVVVTTASLVFNSAGAPYDGVGTWDELLNDAKAADGWIQSMTGGERILTKPTLLGGIVFVPSYVPSSDVCGFGGDSSLYGVYFETGTAYYKTIFSNPATVTYTDAGGDTHAQVVGKISLGAGKASSLGVHVGGEEGAKGFIQQSTGSIVAESLTPALTIKSGLTSWQEK